MNLKETLIIACIMLFTQVSAIFLTVSAKAQHIQMQTRDPQSLISPFLYLVSIIIVTVLLLVMIKYGFHKFIKGLFIFGMWYAVFFLSLVLLPNGALSYFLLLVIPTICAILLWKYPEWYVIDIVGVAACVVGTAVIGSNFGVVPLSVLLILALVYDFIAVYKLKHMITLAGHAIDSNLPVAFIIPKKLPYSILNSKESANFGAQSERKSVFLGFGDIVFPSLLVISAFTFIPGNYYIITGAMVGAVVGVLALQWYSEKYPTAHAGLPFLNSGVLLGFWIPYIIGALLA